MSGVRRTLNGGVAKQAATLRQKILDRQAAEQVGRAAQQQARCYFKVPFSQKDEAKGMGARFDGDRKLWYAANEDVAKKLRSKWKELGDGVKRYFIVDFNEKDQAKAMGAEWDRLKRMWYAHNPDTYNKMKLRWQEADLSPLSLEEHGEDREYGGASRLYFDPLPMCVHGKTLRTMLPPKEFTRLQTSVLQRAGGKCECCDADATLAHPRYKYNMATATMKLKRVMAICKSCKDVNHIGLQQLQGTEGQAIAHLAQVEGITHFEAEQRKGDAEEKWNIRDEVEWEMDLSLLERAGLNPSEAGHGGGGYGGDMYHADLGHGMEGVIDRMFGGGYQY